MKINKEGMQEFLSHSILIFVIVCFIKFEDFFFGALWLFLGIVYSIKKNGGNK